MNIKEIIDAERWRALPYHLTRVKHHNASLDRIEAAVTAYVAVRDPRRITPSYNAEQEALKQRIAELEAQLPKMVTPVDGKCPNCGGWCGWNYCQFCGSKLDNRGKK